MMYAGARYKRSICIMEGVAVVLWMSDLQNVNVHARVTTAYRACIRTTHSAKTDMDM